MKTMATTNNSSTSIGRRQSGRLSLSVGGGRRRQSSGGLLASLEQEGTPFKKTKPKRNTSLLLNESTNKKSSDAFESPLFSISKKNNKSNRGGGLGVNRHNNEGEVKDENSFVSSRTGGGSRIVGRDNTTACHRTTTAASVQEEEEDEESSQEEEFTSDYRDKNDEGDDASDQDNDEISSCSDSSIGSNNSGDSPSPMIHRRRSSPLCRRRIQQMFDSPSDNEEDDEEEEEDSSSSVASSTNEQEEDDDDDDGDDEYDDSQNASDESDSDDDSSIEYEQDDMALRLCGKLPASASSKGFGRGGTGNSSTVKSKAKAAPESNKKSPPARSPAAAKSKKKLPTLKVTSNSKTRKSAAVSNKRAQTKKVPRPQLNVPPTIDLVEETDQEEEDDDGFFVDDSGNEKINSKTDNNVKATMPAVATHQIALTTTVPPTTQDATTPTAKVRRRSRMFTRRQVEEEVVVVAVALENDSDTESDGSDCSSVVAVIVDEDEDNDEYFDDYFDESDNDQPLQLIESPKTADEATFSTAEDERDDDIIQSQEDDFYESDHDHQQEQVRKEPPKKKQEKEESPTTKEDDVISLQHRQEEDRDEQLQVDESPHNNKLEKKGVATGTASQDGSSGEQNKPHDEKKSAKKKGTTATVEEEDGISEQEQEDYEQPQADDSPEEEKKEGDPNQPHKEDVNTTKEEETTATAHDGISEREEQDYWEQSQADEEDTTATSSSKNDHEDGIAEEYFVGGLYILDNIQPQANKPSNEKEDGIAGEKIHPLEELEESLKNGSDGSDVIDDTSNRRGELESEPLIETLREISPDQQEAPLLKQNNEDYCEIHIQLEERSGDECSLTAYPIDIERSDQNQDKADIDFPASLRSKSTFTSKNWQESVDAHVAHSEAFKLTKAETESDGGETAVRLGDDDDDIISLDEVVLATTSGVEINNVVSRHGQKETCPAAEEEDSDNALGEQNEIKAEEVPEDGDVGAVNGIGDNVSHGREVEDLLVDLSTSLVNTKKQPEAPTTPEQQSPSKSGSSSGDQKSPFVPPDVGDEAWDLSADVDDSISENAIAKAAAESLSQDYISPNSDETLHISDHHPNVIVKASDDSLPFQSMLTPTQVVSFSHNKETKAVRAHKSTADAMNSENRANTAVIQSESGGSHQGRKRNRGRRSRREGSIKRDHWKRGPKIGSGSFGVVHIGMDTRTGMHMAIKTVITNDPDVLKEVRNEIELLKSLEHKNIVRYFGAELENNNLHIFQEWVSGGSLTDMLEKFGPFSVMVVGSYVSQLLEGLIYLHDNSIVHRDIKGSNVLVSDKGIVKLADFGSSKRLESEMMQILSYRGTPYFMAPEVFDEMGYSFKADCWSVGCVIFQMITGCAPWMKLGKRSPVTLLGHIKTHPGPPPMELPSGTDETTGIALNELVAKCFRINPVDRPTAKELLTDSFFVRAHMLLSDTDDFSASQNIFSPGSACSWENLQSPNPMADHIMSPSPRRRSKSNNASRTPGSPFLSPPLPYRVGAAYASCPLLRSPQPDSSDWPSWAARAKNETSCLLPETSPTETDSLTYSSTTCLSTSAGQESDTSSPLLGLAFLSN